MNLASDECARKVRSEEMSSNFYLNHNHHSKGLAVWYYAESEVRVHVCVEWGGGRGRAGNLSSHEGKSYYMLLLKQDLLVHTSWIRSPSSSSTHHNYCGTHQKFRTPLGKTGCMV